VDQRSQGSADTIEGPIGDLFIRLSTPQAGAAWTEFLRRYSPLILQVTRRFESEDERVNDCFLYACAQLSDNDFRRLRSFRSDGPAQFRTWLTSVVTNLCIDWRRKLSGRLRPVAAIANLPELDQLVYRFIYVRGMTRAQCLRALAGRYPNLSDAELAAINARLFGLLTPRQRWQSGARARGSLSLDELSHSDSDEAGFQPEEAGPGPDLLAAFEQEREQVEAALGQLPQRQRLLLRLRYQQELTLEEVARLARIPDPYRAHREIQAAVEALGAVLKRRGGQ
jgi:RNA polymerase sigma factor (sigma-70 family)